MDVVDAIRIHRFDNSYVLEQASRSALFCLLSVRSFVHWPAPQSTAERQLSSR